MKPFGDELASYISSFSFFFIRLLFIQKVVREDDLYRTSNMRCLLQTLEAHFFSPETAAELFSDQKKRQKKKHGQ